MFRGPQTYDLTSISLPLNLNFQDRATVIQHMTHPKIFTIFPFTEKKFVDLYLIQTRATDKEKTYLATRVVAENMVQLFP